MGIKGVSEGPVEGGGILSRVRHNRRVRVPCNIQYTFAYYIHIRYLLRLVLSIQLMKNVAQSHTLYALPPNTLHRRIVKNNSEQITSATPLTFAVQSVANRPNTPVHHIYIIYYTIFNIYNTIINSNNIKLWYIYPCTKHAKQVIQCCAGHADEFGDAQKCTDKLTHTMHNI